MFESLLNAFRAPDLRRRLLYVAGILILFRFLTNQRNRLDGHQAVNLGVASAIHHSHGAAANFGLDMITAQCLRK